MALAIYLLLNEKQILGEARPKKLSPASLSKIIGEKKGRDLEPFELQRQRINDESVVTFKSTDNDETYELHEDELAEFDSALRAMKAVKHDIQGDNADGLNTINSKKEKEYYEND